MRLDGLLDAHALLTVQRPPELWAVDTEDVRFVPLLGEMIAAPVSRGAALHDLTLNVSNVVVEVTDDEDAGENHGPAPGEYVAVTVSGPIDLGPDGSWHSRSANASGLLDQLRERLVAAGVRYAYVRRIPPNGSVTVFLPRLNVTA